MKKKLLARRIAVRISPSPHWAEGISVPQVVVKQNGESGEWRKMEREFKGSDNDGTLARQFHPPSVWRHWPVVCYFRRVRWWQPPFTPKFAFGDRRFRRPSPKWSAFAVILVAIV